MTAVMLATYPEVFAGGAVIAGLPFGTALSVPEALERMRGHGGPGDSELTALVRSATRHEGPWPTLSIWHGTGDATVHHSNAAHLVEQWRALHQLPAEPSRTEMVNGYPHRVWSNPSGRDVLEEYRITGMAHGTPLDTRGRDSGEVAGPFLLDAGISSTRLIAQFWNLGVGKVAPVRRESTPLREAVEETPAPLGAGIARTIDDALRAAGLMH
jgi:poly(3-hydroxybutyrate) depolymerase